MTRATWEQIVSDPVPLHLEAYAGFLARGRGALVIDETGDGAGHLSVYLAADEFVGPLAALNKPYVAEQMASYDPETTCILIAVVDGETWSAKSTGGFVKDIDPSLN
jgi:hypothetical protein